MKSKVILILLVALVLAFDWGVFEPCGELILTVTALIYLVLIVTSIRRWSRGYFTARHHWVIKLIGFGCIAIMVAAAFGSVLLQITSAHYQNATHIPAVSIIVGVWLSIRMAGRDPESTICQALRGDW